MEKERLKFCIERFDHYFDSVNNKSALFLGLSTFIIGGLIAAYQEVFKIVECDFWVHILILAMLSLGIAITLILISASIPFNGKSKETLYYFGFIANLKEEDFLSKSEERKEKQEFKDLRIQVHQLSKGLNKKFSKLKIAGRLFMLQFLILIPLIVLIVINFK